ncbi:hypothetical protein LCGC14_0432710 [marine sediment metagenome]|uniref:Uncharacterized protein n=1 Tax=marine sediment metagenome TaxID=412755 RepID=A0A0F9V9I5_9ZZZZ
MKQTTLTCNYCNKEFEYEIEIGDGYKEEDGTTHICANPECTVYALYQVPMEGMPKKNKTIR